MLACLERAQDPRGYIRLDSGKLPKSCSPYHLVNQDKCHTFRREPCKGSETLSKVAQIVLPLLVSFLRVKHVNEHAHMGKDSRLLSGEVAVQEAALAT